MNSCQSLVWSEFDCIEARAAEYLKSKEASTKQEAFEMACQDSDSLSFEYEDFLSEFDSILHKISASGFFFVEGRNMGWRHLSGYLGVSAMDARSFLCKAFPKTSEFCTVRQGKFCEERDEVIAS